MENWLGPLNLVKYDFDCNFLSGGAVSELFSWNAEILRHEGLILGFLKLCQTVMDPSYEQSYAEGKCPGLDKTPCKCETFGNCFGEQ